MIHAVMPKVVTKISKIITSIKVQTDKFAKCTLKMMCQYDGMKGVCAGHVQRSALVDGARIGAQNAIYAGVMQR